MEPLQPCWGDGCRGSHNCHFSQLLILLIPTFCALHPSSALVGLMSCSLYIYNHYWSPYFYCQTAYGKGATCLSLFASLRSKPGGGVQRSTTYLIIPASGERMCLGWGDLGLGVWGWCGSCSSVCFFLGTFFSPIWIWMDRLIPSFLYYAIMWAQYQSIYIVLFSPVLNPLTLARPD